MQPTAYYRKLLNEIQEPHVRLCLSALSWHVGKENAISLDELTEKVFGKNSESNSRKTRVILDRLVDEYGIPVGASSGQAGRWIIANEVELYEVAAELRSRREKLAQRENNLYQAKFPVKVDADRLQKALF